MLFHGKVGSLCSTLYHNHGEIEAFICADNNSMLGYSTVSRYPEILYTIDEAICNLTGKRISLGNKWIARNPKRMLVEFDIKINEISYINGLKDILNDYSSFYDSEKYLENTYEDYDDIPECFWYNEWIVRNCLDNFCIFDGCYGETCLGVKSNVELTPERISISCS